MTKCKNEKPPEYSVWVSMRSRCQTSNPYYGGRGIVVCERWRNSFADFLADMGPRPSAAHSIDRYPNNDGNYEPGNCRWATKNQQARNTRRTKLITVGDKSMTLGEWRENGMFQKRENPSGVGRPIKEKGEKTVVVAVSMSPDLAAFAKEIGKGSLSKGVQIALSAEQERRQSKAKKKGK